MAESDNECEVDSDATAETQSFSLSTSGSGSSGTPDGKRARRIATSVALAKGWMTRFFDDIVGSTNKSCKVCKKLVKSTDIATSNFARHVRMNHPDEVLQFNAAMEAKRGAGTIDKYVNKEPKVLGVGGDSSLISASRKARIDDTIIEYVCMDMEPLTLKNREGLRRLLSVVAPGYAIPDYRTMRYNLLPRKVQEIRSEVTNLIRSSVHLAVTVDMWTSRAMMSFAGVTIHAVTSSMQPQMAVLACKHFPGRHTGEAICSELHALFEENHVMRKIVRVLTDNGANIVKAFRLPEFSVETTNDGEENDRLLAAAAMNFDTAEDNDDGNDATSIAIAPFDRVSCAAHTLQLVIKNGFEADKRAGVLISKVSRLCGAVRKSSTDTETVLGESNLHFVNMNATRWNSQYEMIDRFLRVMRESPDLLTELQCKVGKDLKDKLTPNDMRNLQDLVDLLNAFNHATKILQSQTSSGGALVPTLYALWLHLVGQRDRCRFTTKICVQMLNEMTRRFADSVRDPMWLTCAVLDPRFRLAFCRPIPGFTTLTVADVHRIVFTELKKAYGEYHAQGVSLDDSDSVSDNTKPRKEGGFFSSVLQHDNNDNVGDAEDSKLVAQFDSYVSAAVIDADEDIFRYIRERAMADYPRLVPAWRKFLCIPATSAPIECVFSTAGDIVTQDRCSLLGDVVEDLVFVKRNIRLRHNQNQQ